MEILIITTNSIAQGAFWHRHFDLLSQSFPSRDQMILIIYEDWNGGAGNGLGSLYCYQKARTAALKKYQIDILDKQKQGASVVMYHTAGQGTRLAPLTCSEHNNKSAVKLPGIIANSSIYTILDAIIKQTSQYIPHKEGRFSVFWGDQVFLPAKTLSSSFNHHACLLSRSLAMPSEKEWVDLHFDAYGLIASNGNNEPHILDKCSYPAVLKLIQEKKICIENGIGQSLGSFSLSFPLTQALLELFKKELEQKTEKWDTDPFFWMPTTLDENTYLSIMQAKKCPEHVVKAHYQRMQKFKKSFCSQFPDSPYFSVVDIGKEGYWWDYGTLENYFKNILKLCGTTPEGETMRDFFNVPLGSNSSCLMNCEIGNGRIENSILVNVKAASLDVKNCVIINSKLNTLKGNQSLIYNVQETSPITLESNTVRADVSTQDQYFKMYTKLERDGNTDWTIRLPGNPLSYEELSLINSG